MSGAELLRAHRSSFVSETVRYHARLLGASGARPEVGVLVIGEPSEEATSLADAAMAAGAQVTRTDTVAAGSAQHDVVVHLGRVASAKVESLAGRLNETGILLIVISDHGSDLELLDSLRSRFARVVELAQTGVSGSAISSNDRGPGFVGVHTLDPNAASPRVGAAQEHTIVLAADRPLGLYVMQSVLTVAPPTPEPPGDRRRRPWRGRGRVVEPIPMLEPANVLPDHPNPIVSIVVAVQDDWPTAMQCLTALASVAVEVPTEVIIVDAAASSEGRPGLDTLVGAHICRSADGCDRRMTMSAVFEEARGQLILELDSWLVPQVGSIDRMVARIRSDETIGIVGAKILNLDRTVQSAGRIVWRDGTLHDIGRGRGVDDRNHDGPSDVDSSGRAALVRREILEDAHGRGAGHTTPTYIDADLSFAARRAGYRVVVEPRAWFVDRLAPDARASGDASPAEASAADRSTFVERWTTELLAHAPPSQSVAMARSREASRRILVVDHAVPTHDRDGGSLRMLRLLTIMRALGHAVWFLPVDGLLRQPYTQGLVDLGVEIIGPNEDLPTLLREIGSGLDAIVLSRRSVAWSTIDVVREFAPTAPVVFDTVDLHFVRELSELVARGHDDVAGHARAHRGRGMELALIGLADQTWVVSTDEARMLRELVPNADIALIPNVHDAEPTSTPFRDRQGLLFVGSFHHAPNVDSLVWTIEEILPSIRRALPDVRLHIVGDGLPDSLRARLDESCIVHGAVDDLRAHYETVRIALAPLRYGAGMKGKVAEALAMGVPMVTTPTGAAGMPAAVRAFIYEGATAQDLVRLTIDGYTDRTRWDEIHAGAPQAIGSVYGEAAARKSLERALAALDGAEDP